MAALAALKEKLPKQEEETPSSKYAGKKLSAKEQMEAALDLESDEEEKKVMKQLVCKAKSMKSFQRTRRAR